MMEPREVGQFLGFLLLAIIAVGAFYGSPTPRENIFQESPPHDAKSNVVAPLPEEQAKFCGIIADASAPYRAAWERWRNEENGLRQSRMGAELDRMEENRNTAIN